MYNLYIKEKRNKEQEQKLIEEGKMKVMSEKRQSKQRISYNNLLLYKKCQNY